MAVDMTVVTVATIIGGVVSTIASRLFGRKVRPECVSAFDALEAKVLKLQLDSTRDSTASKAHRIEVERRLGNIESKLDRLIEGKIGHIA